MTVLIKIPKEFEQHFKEDAFEDSLRRLNADAICCDRMSGNYEAELCEMLITAFAEAKEVPTPHGDLIDRGTLLAYENQHYEYHSDGFYVDTRTIELAPTIIKAEGKDINVLGKEEGET